MQCNVQVMPKLYTDTISFCIYTLVTTDHLSSLTTIKVEFCSSVCVCVVLKSGPPPTCISTYRHGDMTKILYSKNNYRMMEKWGSRDSKWQEDIHYSMTHLCSYKIIGKMFDNVCAKKAFMQIAKLCHSSSFWYGEIIPIHHLWMSQSSGPLFDVDTFVHCNGILWWDNNIKQLTKPMRDCMQSAYDNALIRSFLMDAFILKKRVWIEINRINKSY